MNVSSQITYQRKADAMFRKVSVGLNWQDLVRLVGDGKVAGYTLDTPLATDIDPLPAPSEIVDGDGKSMPVALMYRVLQAQADMLVWNHAYNDGGAQREIVAEEIKKARARTGDILTP